MQHRVKVGNIRIRTKKELFDRIQPQTRTSGNTQDEKISFLNKSVMSVFAKIDLCPDDSIQFRIMH